MVRLLSKEEVKMNFKDLIINENIMKAIDEMGYETPTPIQAQAIPNILSGKDLLGCAQTGTGKTAAFALPLIDKLIKEDNENPKRIKVLVLTPTRELAIQIRDNFRSYGKHTDIKCSVIFGGVNQASQVEVLKKGVDVLVATPGRLLDLINQRYAKLDKVETLVLDEADSMLDMGFIHDVKKIISHVPSNRQTLMFSATMPKEINELAETFLKNPVTVKVTPVSSTVEIIDQKIYFVDRGNKVSLLIDILKQENIRSVLIFTRTKHGANKLSTSLLKENISNGVIHGNKSQSARVSALNDFKTGITRVLIATDIAARGIDINELSHVINFDMPEQAETYVHRIGRTGRAGLDGIAISLCDINEKSNLRDIENLIKQRITEVIDHNYPMMILQPTPKTQKNNTQFKRSSRSVSNRDFPRKPTRDSETAKKDNKFASGNKFERKPSRDSQSTKTDSKFSSKNKFEGISAKSNYNDNKKNFGSNKTFKKNNQQGSFSRNRNNNSSRRSSH
jgi:ATP-dependent RNA helicase RhlE